MAAIAVLRATSVRAGNRDTSAYGIHQVAGSTAFTIMSGRSPVAPDEVVAGAETLRRLGSRLGATVSPEGPDGPVEMRVVGIAALPPIDNPSLAVGFGMTAEGLSQLVHSGGFPEVVVTARSGVDMQALADRLAENVSSLQDSRTPGEVTSLDQVRALPVLLAGSLGLVGAAAVTHAVVSALRRRRRDLAILKALGFSRRQVAATVRWQANTLVAIGLVLGIPLGLVAGRWSWSILARAVGVAEDPLIPIASVALVVPAALLLATLVAAPAGRLAARTRAAVILRQE